MSMETISMVGGSSRHVSQKRAKKQEASTLTSDQRWESVANLIQSVFMHRSTLCFPANTRHSPNAGTMLGQRRIIVT